MKPRYLEFCGVNSFSERAQIDFTNLLEFGIFGIFGDTGSGKSTVLDCIGFALYGNVLRSRAGSIADIINYKRDEAYVHFEFEILFEGARGHYRVERTLKRKNAAQSVIVYEYTEGAFRAVAAGVRESNALLERIIGLEQKDFEKCIALPQGEFAQFVKAQRGDRLKLISRLFDLERYGERLVKKANSECNEKLNNLRVLEARLKPYEAVTAEANRALAQEILALKEADREAQKRLAAAQAEEKELSARLEKRREAERVEARLNALKAKHAEMATLKGELSRLGSAAAVFAAKQDADRTAERLEKAQARWLNANRRLDDIEKQFASFSQSDEEALDAEIESLTALYAQAVQAEELRARKQRAERRLEEIAQEIEKEEQALGPFEYENTRSRLEEELASLSGDFLAFAKTHCKAALLRGEYAVFAEEISDLTKKYPVIKADSVPLAEKYRTLAQGEVAEFSEIRRAFAEREERKKSVQAALFELESEKGRRELAFKRISHFSAEAHEHKKTVSECDSRLTSVPELAESIKAQLEQKRTLKRVASENRRRYTEGAANCRAELAAAQEAKRAAELAWAEGNARLESALFAGGFQDARAAEALVEKYGEPEKAQRQYEAYASEYAAISARSRELAAEDFSEATEERLALAVKSVRAEEACGRECAKRLALAERELERAKALLAEKEELKREHSAANADFICYDQLKKLIDGNKFMEFVAEEYLQQISSNASGRLLSLTDGRYFLRYQKGFFVGDNFNGGELRGVYTLSGGETFLVSLSLALALGAEICARSLRPIEFFFLDEGFGTLDSHLVDTVMDSLERLRSENFSIGIISHVGELKHRIDRKLLVKKATEQHGSQIHAE